MLRLLADENFNADVVRGLLRRKVKVDVIHVHDAGLSGSEDPYVLDWAAEHDRIVLTHDRATMPDYALDRLARGLKMTGIFIFHDRLPVGQVISELILVIECSDMSDWNQHIVYMPL
jgi:predicted nuclease of predicted toxin-antitoxin system